VNAPARTGLVTHPDCLRHDPGEGHPERPERLNAILGALGRSGLFQQLASLAAPLAEPADFELVHAPRYVAALGEAARQAPVLLDGGDTVLSTGSWNAASRAVGGALAAVDRVLSGEWGNAFVAARPPGHHAESDRAMGFCLFNQVAIAARHLRTRRGLERVAILDFDVHHGNGTQHAFESDPTVLYASLHQFPLYPGTGAARERGVGDGVGATLNCPQPPGAGESEWMASLEREVIPALEKFRPQFLLLSAGFDAHAEDPLAQQELATETYRRITQLCTSFARQHCDGRIVAVLEGGYALDALAASVHVHLEELRAAAT
jgi:acetoin utilization deacetylase AcuC-like enzyme